jgi:hypothetical protein
MSALFGYTKSRWMAQQMVVVVVIKVVNKQFGKARLKSASHCLLAAGVQPVSR